MAQGSVNYAHVTVAATAPIRPSLTAISDSGEHSARSILKQTDASVYFKHEGTPMTMTGEQERSKARHQRILDAALDVFSRRGYRDAAVDDIAAASETSKGGIYFHFPNKGAIFHALMRRTAGLLLDRTEAAMAGVDDPIARVDAALATVLRLFAEHRTLARLFLVEALGAGPEFSAALMEVHSSFAQLIARHLDEAARLGAIAPLDTEQAGIAWFGALNEVVVRWVLTGKPERLEEVYPALRALLLRSVGAPVGGRSPAGTPAAPAAPLSLDELRDRLHDARRRARLHDTPVLVSLSRTIPTVDPLDLFAQAEALGHDRLYWERMADGAAVAGAGTAHAVEATTPAAAGCAWRKLLEHALIDAAAAGAMSGPLLLGGFAFDAAHTGTPLWAGFPAGRLAVPRVGLATSGATSTLTVNTVLRPDDDVEAEAARLLRWVETVFPIHPRPDRWQGEDLRTENALGREEWEALVADAAAACGVAAPRGDMALDKVVLARAVRAHALAPFDAAAALARLRAAYPSAFVFAVARGVHCFMGATPERLVRLRDRDIDVACLAGSAPRGETPEEDSYLGNALMASAKDRAEHEIVVRAVRAALDGICTEMRVPAAPRLLRLYNVQHLYTPVEARAGDGICVLDLVERLHPTPAVGGFPSEAALRFIHARENLDRGWYAGPVGWLDRRGEGEFAMALRCALIHGTEATLFAGSGIVAGSRPADEYDETCLKLRPMLAALGARQD